VLAGFPGTDIQLVDTDTSREQAAKSLKIGFATPDAAAENRDLVIHASATQAGLNRALDLLRPEGTVVELSWHGDRQVAIPLGEHFHSRRLTIRSSQVGAIRPDRHRDYADRLKLALTLLQDSRFETLISGRSSFDELPKTLTRLADGSMPALCHVIDYPSGN
jgi:threonine dehydrogenase-like Zn-dependent dehydrogenase